MVSIVSMGRERKLLIPNLFPVSSFFSIFISFCIFFSFRYLFNQKTVSFLFLSLSLKKLFSLLLLLSLFLYHKIKDEPCQSTFLFHEFPHSLTLRFPSPLRFYFFLSLLLLSPFFLSFFLSLRIVFFHFSPTINTHSSVKRLNWWLKRGKERRGRMKNVKKKRKEYLEGMKARNGRSEREKKN